MASVQLQAGASIDLATKGDLQAAVDDLKQSIVLPTLYRELTKTVLLAASFGTPVIIPLGTPSDAVVWDLRTLTLTGADDHTAIANVSGAIYAGQLMNNALAQVDVRWTGLTVPSSSTWNAQIVALRKRGLWVALSGSGLAQGQSYTVTASVIEVQAEDASRYFS